ncbi:hypothetical protein A7P53_02250 [Acinetobacter defluvii]|uniref:hypothetical protein n=1 Tax=Acinetobacter defluvii TaxID=1871111 RepID=UPI00148F7C3B|nr:hypothetical protein [Acinetobacter defluvii]NNP74359.1 hypothetical protein [Acinetobacter defluvii]
MHLIEQQAHFWELYQDDTQYYFAIAIDMSSVVSCWYIHLDAKDELLYQENGRQFLEDFAQEIVQQSYRGDFSFLEQREVSEQIQQAMQQAFKAQN